MPHAPHQASRQKAPRSSSLRAASWIIIRTPSSRCTRCRSISDQMRAAYPNKNPLSVPIIPVACLSLSVSVSGRSHVSQPLQFQDGASASVFQASAKDGAAFWAGQLPELRGVVASRCRQAVQGQGVGRATSLTSTPVPTHHTHQSTTCGAFAPGSAVSMSPSELSIAARTSGPTTPSVKPGPWRTPLQ
jgi:hypothetical protein